MRRLGDVEGQNLAVERYSGEGRPERLADLAREGVSRNPDGVRCDYQPHCAGGPRARAAISPGSPAIIWLIGPHEPFRHAEATAAGNGKIVFVKLTMNYSYDTF